MAKYFTRDEFKCKCGKCVNMIQDEFIEQMDSLREKYGKPIFVNSGYRCPSHNNEVSSTGFNGPHTTGRAGDFKIDRGDAVHLLELALAIPYFKGFGVNQKGLGRFLHLDASRDTRTIWSY